MDYKQYQEESQRTFSYRKEALSTKDTDLLHCAIGASTEAAELLDAFKKNIFYGKELDIVNIGEEIADQMWYLSNLCRLLGLDFEKILENNISKLKARYPDKFSSEKAINRDLETERKILEGGIVVTEDRSLENGGVKPPKNNWTSYADNIVLQEEEKFSLKKELLDSNIDVNQKSNGLSLSDIESAFGHLEVIDCSFVPKLMCNINNLKEFATANDIDISKDLKRIKNAELIPISMFDFFSMKNDTICNKFIALINFNQMSGTLKLEKALTTTGTLLTKDQIFELEKYCRMGGIEHE